MIDYAERVSRFTVHICKYGFRNRTKHGPTKTVTQNTCTTTTYLNVTKMGCDQITAILPFTRLIRYAERILYWETTDLHKTKEIHVKYNSPVKYHRVNL